jgi:hypothetical protein
MTSSKAIIYDPRRPLELIKVGCQATERNVYHQAHDELMHKSTRESEPTVTRAVLEQVTERGEGKQYMVAALDALMAMEAQQARWLGLRQATASHSAQQQHRHHPSTKP